MVSLNQLFGSRMENTYPANLNFLKSVVDVAPVPIGVYKGSNLEIILANKCMIDTYGKSNDVIGKSYMEILPELAGQGIFEQLQVVLQTGKPFNAKNQRVDIVIDGTLRTHYFNYDFTPIYHGDHSVYAVMNTAVDVTHLNLARKKVAEAEEKLKLAVQAADLGSFELDLSTGTVATSVRFTEIWGLEPKAHYPHSDLVGKIHKHDLQARETAIDNAQRTHNLNYEARIMHPDEAVRWVRVKGTLLQNENGDATSILGIVQDITEHKQFANKLKKLVKKRTKDLKRSNEDLLQFAHVVSHDLKEPVRKIKIYNELLKSELQPVLPERGKVYFEKVQHASDRIFLMIDGILNYSTMNASGNPNEKVDLNTIVSSVFADLELVIEQKNANLSVASIPTIEGSPILMHQLFYNLINNALKFSRDEVAPEISIQQTQSGNTLTVLVIDNGIGIDDKYTKEIFNVFQRLHPKEKYEGTGLGLSLCRKIVERHHGTIEASGRSDGHSGTEFKITLPLIQPSKKSI